MSALQELLSNQHWMIHDLVDGNQIDNEEEKRLLDVYEKAKVELASLRVERDEEVRKNQILMSACGKAARHIIELHNGVETTLDGEAMIEILDKAVLENTPFLADPKHP